MTTFIVSNGNSMGNGSFRQALTDLATAPSGVNYTINFTGTYDVDPGLIENPKINKSVTINGNNSIIRNILGIPFVSIDANNGNVVINNIRFYNVLDIVVLRGLIECTNTNLTLTDCRFTSSYSIISATDILQKSGYILTISDGSLNINTTYEGGSSISGFYISMTLSDIGIPPSLIYSINCPITISGSHKMVIENNNCTYLLNLTTDGFLIYTNSSINLNNVIIRNIMTDPDINILVNTSLIQIYNVDNTQVTLDNCDFTNIGFSTGLNRLLGLVYSDISIILDINDCTFDSINGGTVFNLTNNSIITIESINRESSFTSSTSIFLNAASSIINVGNNSNYNFVFEDNNTNDISEISSIFNINLLNGDSSFRKCVLRNNISNSYNTGILINNSSGNVTIEDSVFGPTITNNGLIDIFFTSGMNFILRNNTFTNINGGLIRVVSPITFIHGNNLITNCDNGSNSLISFSDVTMIINGDNTIISDVPSNAINISASNYYNVCNFSFINVEYYCITLSSAVNQNSSIINCDFNSCGYAIFINASSKSSYIHTISNCEFTNSVINNITAINAIINIVDCKFSSNANNQTDGYIVSSNSEVQMSNGSISIYSVLSTRIVSLINISSADTLNIEKYEIETVNRLVIKVANCNANWCNFKGNTIPGLSNNMVCINSNYFNLNGISITGFDNGIVNIDNSNNSILSNSTISNNNSGLNIYNTDILGCTIMDNDVGINVNNNNRIANTLIANNINNINILSGGTITSLGNNATNVDSTSTFTLPTDIISPLVLENIGPLENNGGIADTYALLNNNICLGKGNVEYAVSSYDNRGEGYNRVVDGNVDIGSYENQNPIVCFTSDSEVLVDRDGVVKYECVKNVVAGDKVVVKDVSNGEYESSTVVHNVITGKRKWFIRIEKDGIDVDEPFKTTHFTGGHMLVIGGKEIKARDIVGKNDIRCSKVKLEEQDVHSFVLEDRSYVNVNGVLNVAFGREEWYRLVKRMNIVWRDNKL